MASNFLPPEVTSSSSTSTTLSTVTSIPTPPSGKNPHLTTTEIIEVVIASVACFLALVAILGCVLVQRRWRKKYQHPEDNSKIADSIESAPVASVSKSFHNGNWHSISEHRGTAPLLTATQTQQSLNHSLVNSNSPQYFKDAHVKPSSFVNGYGGQVVSLNDSQVEQNHNGFDTATLLPARPNYWNSPITLAPLSIPETSQHPSNGKRSMKTEGSVRSSKTLETYDSASLYSEASALTSSSIHSATSSTETIMPPPPVPPIPPRFTRFSRSTLESYDSASLYSEASALASIHSSTSSTGTIMPPPPVPPFPLHFTTPSQSTLPKSADVSALRREETIIKLSPISPLFARVPTSKINGDEPEDDTEIHNVAQLLYSRQLKLSKASDPPSRNSSIVSHIERSGSIKPVSPSKGEDELESYRLRYDRLKQNKDFPGNSYPTKLYDSSIFMPQ